MTYSDSAQSLPSFLSDCSCDEAVATVQASIKTAYSNKASQRFFRQLDCCNVERGEYDLSQSAPSIELKRECSQYTTVLTQLKPWRKGPFKLGKTHIESEWESWMKWDRVMKAVDVVDKNVLDVGAGNGYYLYRAAGEGAKIAMGLDPHLHYVHQFHALQYAFLEPRVGLLPLGAQVCSQLTPMFDVVMCLGVLYHHRNPLELFTQLAMPLSPAGELLIETLIIDDDADTELKLPGRYAAMKKIQPLPSLKRLDALIQAAGLRPMEVIDVTQTTPQEQHVTPWACDMSLNDFLDPHDSDKTIEGHPAPLRALVKTGRLE